MNKFMCTVSRRVRKGSDFELQRLTSVELVFTAYARGRIGFFLLLLLSNSCS